LHTIAKRQSYLSEREVTYPTCRRVKYVYLSYSRSIFAETQLSFSQVKHIHRILKIGLLMLLIV